MCVDTFTAFSCSTTTFICNVASYNFLGFSLTFIHTTSIFEPLTFSGVQV